MAVFDVAQQRMCVRVVYDGLASAGKTTNVRQLAELFATQRTCEVISPAEMDGRTLYFDWLQIAAGMVCGFPLVCQVITVPGQGVLTPRRRHLLSTADVVVHVCDSDAQAAGRAREGLALLEAVERERGEALPLVVQANKQDQPGALSGAALVASLGCGAVPVVEAIASDGIGVVDTFVAAVRAVVRAIQARVDGGRVEIAIRPAESADAVLAALQGEAVDPEWELEMLLEEASNTFALGGWSDADVGRAAPEEDAAPHRTTDAAEGPRPPFPTEHVPTGFVWPAHTGRATLRMLDHEGAARAIATDANGASRADVGAFVLTTTREARFDHPEAARQALVRGARERTQLGPLLAPETVLVAQPCAPGDDDDGATWLWTILPRAPSVAELALARESPIAPVLAGYGAAVAYALTLEAAQGIVLDLAPTRFGVVDGVVRYLGDLGASGAERDTGVALLDALATLAATGADLEPALGAIEAGIATLAADEREKLAARAASIDAWRHPSSSSEALGAAKGRIKAALTRGREAA